MIIYRKLVHEDYDDIVDISKDIWGGTDYLPYVFHKWVDDEGFFMGAVDEAKDKVVGVGKYTILHDDSGWLEGLRVHKDYRGKKIGKEISYKLFKIALGELDQSYIKKIAFGTHISSKESIGIMKKLGFKIEQEYILVSKKRNNLGNIGRLEDYEFLPWNVSLEEFLSLDYFKRRNNILPLAFVFQNPTEKLYQELKNENAFVTINGHRGIYKLKGDPYFISIDDDFEGINAFMNYYSLLLSDKNITAPSTSIIQDKFLIDKLKQNGFSSDADWKPDYLYFTYKR